MVHISVLALIPKLTQIGGGLISVFIISQICFNDQLKFSIPKDAVKNENAAKERSFVI